jgi:hypothetical protein
MPEPEITEASGQAAEAAPEQAEGTAATGEAPQEPTFDVDGNSYTLSQMREFRDSGLRQADYTRKTQELARLRGELEPLETWRNLIQTDPQFVQHLRGYFERTQGQSPEQEEVDPNILAVRQQLAQQQSALNWLSSFAMRQQVDATVSSLAERYKDSGVTTEFIDTKVIPVASKLGLYTPEGLELALRGLLHDQSVQKAKEDTEKSMKALGTKRKQAAFVGAGSGGKLPAKALDTKDMTYDQIADAIKRSGVLDGSMIPEP